MDPAIGTFLGGAAVGAILSGLIKFVADFVKDTRDHRAGHETELRAAYGELAAACEEAQAVTLLHALRLESEGDKLSEQELRALDEKAFNLMGRMGGASARLSLLENDPELRKDARKLSGKFSMVVVAQPYTGRIFTKPANAQDDLSDAYRAFADLLAKASIRRAIERRVYRSPLPSAVARIWHSRISKKTDRAAEPTKVPEAAVAPQLPPRES